MKALFSIFILSFLVSFQLLSQGIFDVTKFNAQMNFDGHVNEPGWENIPPLELKEQSPNYGNAPSEKVEIRLTYDENYIYLSGKIRLSDPAFFRATTFKRDAMDGTSDYFGFSIDSYNDNENALGFFTSPAGLRFDAWVIDEGEK